GAFPPSLVKAHFLVLISGLSCPMKCTSGVLRPSGASVLECHDAREEGFFGGLPRTCVGVGEHEFFVGYDLQIDAAVGIILTFRAAHYDQTCPPQGERRVQRAVWSKAW